MQKRCEFLPRNSGSINSLGPCLCRISVPSRRCQDFSLQSFFQPPSPPHGLVPEPVPSPRAAGDSPAHPAHPVQTLALPVIPSPSRVPGSSPSPTKVNTAHGSMQVPWQHTHGRLRSRSCNAKSWCLHPTQALAAFFCYHQVKFLLFTACS